MTTSLKPTGESPSALTYEMEAIILTEIGMPTIHTEIHKEENTEVVIKDLDTADKLWEATTVLIGSY